MTTLTVRREELEDPAYGAAEKGDAGSDPFKNGPNQNFAAIYNDGTAYLNGTPNQFTQMTHPFATGDEDARGSDDPEYAQYLAQLKKTACILNYVATLSLNAMENDYNFFDNSNFYDSLWEDDDYSFSNDLWNNDPPLDLDWNDWNNLSFGTDFGLFDRPWGDAGFSFFGGSSNDLPQGSIPSELITGSLSTDNPFGTGIFNFSDIPTGSSVDLISPVDLWTKTADTITDQNPDGSTIQVTHSAFNLNNNRLNVENSLQPTNTRATYDLGNITSTLTNQPVESSFAPPPSMPDPKVPSLVRSVTSQEIFALAAEEITRPASLLNTSEPSLSHRASIRQTTHSQNYAPSLSAMA